jgi:hypothetical protein
MKNLELTLERWKIVKACRRVRGWFTKPVPLANILSFFYLVVLASVAMAIDTCEEGEVVGETYWLTQQLNCMTHNELGDFLAGASAPLAFLWLVVAVFIQSKELAEQRRELELTRKEYKLNRDEMKASTAQLKSQTVILEEEQTRRRTATADEEYRQLISKLEETMAASQYRFLTREITHNPDIIATHPHEGTEGKMHNVGLRAFSKTPLNKHRLAFSFFFEVFEQYQEQRKTIALEVISYKCTNKTELYKSLSTAVAYLEELARLHPLISTMLRIEYSRCNWEFVTEKVELMRDDILELPNEFRSIVASKDSP